MTKKTKKTGSTGRFGPRYGSQLKKRFLKIEKVQRAAHRCPDCASLRVRRKSIGIWTCKKCGLNFAGGAWMPITSTGRAAARTTASIEEERIQKSKK
ncbi:MAG: 50S ribosomal protein L37ae [Candidatus Heimdallarchaeota archaeon]|nr:50S ribosomal protein L37ae [Candidatus Heimdallarchaeota archaeon]